MKLQWLKAIENIQILFLYQNSILSKKVLSSYCILYFYNKNSGLYVEENREIFVFGISEKSLVKVI